MKQQFFSFKGCFSLPLLCRVPQRVLSFSIGKSSPELVKVQAGDIAIQKLGMQDLVKVGEVLRTVSA